MRYFLVAATIVAAVASAAVLAAQVEIPDALAARCQAGGGCAVIPLDQLKAMLDQARKTCGSV